MTTITRILCLIAAIGLAACEQANIVAPANNFVSTDKPESFEISFTNQAPAVLAMHLNSSDVTEHFTVTETGASADGALLADYVYSGRNIFRITAGAQMKQVVFYHDTTGPEIHILEADREALTVTGYVKDPGGIVSVTLDGVDVPLGANNSFTTSYTDQAFNIFEATDSFDQTSVTTFARNDNTFNGLSAYLSQGGLDFLTPVLEEALSGSDLGPILATIGAVTITIPNPLGQIAVDVEITDMYMENLDLGLTLQESERLDVGLYAENLVVGLRLSNIDYSLDFLNLLGGLEVGATVTTTDDSSGNNYLDVLTLLALGANNGNIDLDTNNTDLDVSGLDLQLEATGISLFDSIASFIIDGLLDVMLALFTDLITALADHLIIPLVSQFLSELSIGVSLEDIDGKGANIDFNATPDYLATSASGLGVRLATNASAPTPPAHVPTSLGSLYVDGIAPIMPATTPDGSSFDFGIALSSNVLNQILVAAHDSGLTTIDLGPGIYAGALNDAILEGDLVGVRIIPASAPYVTLGNANGAAGTLYWYDLSVALDIYRESWGEYRTIFGATLNVEVPFGVYSTFGGYLGLAIDQIPTIEVTATDAGSILPIPAGFITSTLEFVMPVVMPVLANQLEVIPLPSIFDHTLFMEEFWVVGGADNNNSLALAGKLIPIGLAESADAPTTNIDGVTYLQTVVEMEAVAAGGIVTTSTVTLDNGAVNIAISGNNPNPEYGDLQYRYRVDGGGWSAWLERTSVELDNFLAGSHTVEICARSGLMKEETDCPTVEFTTTQVE